jgi:serine/threonine-protein kinase
MACVVMEMLDGESLASYIARKGSLSVSEALGLLLPAMRGVAAANAQGVIHRDLKPQNIFICIEPDGRIVTTKVLDFGISVIVKEQVMDPSAGPAKVMGTLAYMSPENLLGEANIDARTDVYGCGVLFYEALTGQVPFPGEPGLALIDHVLNKPALPVAILRPDLSPGLVRIIEKAMAKERDHRYSDVNAMMSALEKELIPPASAPRLPTPHAGVPPHERLNDGSNNGQPPPHTDRQTRVVMPSPGRPALRGPRRLSSFRRWHKLLGASLAAALGFMVVLAFAHGARVQGGEAALVAPTTLPASQLVAPSAVKSARAAATVAPVAVSAPLATSPSQLAPIAQATGKDGHPANHPRAMRAPAATGHSRGSVGKPALRPQTQRRAWETDELPRPSSRAPTARVLTRSTEPRAGRIFTHDF